MGKRKRGFRYRVYGEGEPVVLVPGLDGLTEFFADVVPELARRNQVILYELPLRGEADAAGTDYSFEYLASDLKSVLDELGIARAHIVGESFGGVVSQTFALNHPEAVQTLTLISSAPHFEVSRKNRMLLPLFRITPMWLFARVHLSDVCEPEDPAWAKRLFVRGASYADHASVFARAQIVSRVDLRSRVSELRCPVLLVVGSRDRFTGDASRHMAKLVPQAQVVAIEGGGHLCHMTHPKPFLAAVQPFLAGASA
jgi:pimeloyl-ACP methyl ester carboxylesterase